MFRKKNEGEEDDWSAFWWVEGKNELGEMRKNYYFGITFGEEKRLIYISLVFL